MELVRTLCKSQSSHWTGVSASLEAVEKGKISFPSWEFKSDSSAIHPWSSLYTDSSRIMETCHFEKMAMLHLQDDEYKLDMNTLNYIYTVFCVPYTKLEKTSNLLCV
jgi:hypothetical protein